MRHALSLILGVYLTALGSGADWPTLRGNVQRTGYVADAIPDSLSVAWGRHFAGERLGPAVEPIVSDGRLFIGTHQGNLYSVDAATGEPSWRFSAAGAFLHSPAVEQGIVVAACSAGFVYALDAGSGRLRWSHDAGPGGFAASPAIAEGTVLIGSRRGEFLALDLRSGQLRWKQQLGAPIRQTAALEGGRIFVMAEDMRLRCLESRTGRVHWTSPAVNGQTARDYYPVIVRDPRRTRVVVRTSPIHNMARRIMDDRHELCQQAQVDDRDWRTLDAWTRNPDALGNEEVWSREQAAIRRYLSDRPAARTFFQFDAETGESTGEAPVLWIGGCQSVGTPPVALPDGRMFVLHRSAYGNWNHGVAPLVSLGFLEAEQRISPVHHQHGMQPPWDTFWGTADESQNFVVAGDQVLIVHQATLTRFDLKTRKLTNLAGTRDGWGGFRNLPWARNEWNGPARGGVAVAAGRVYWQTGSRIICLADQRSDRIEDVGVDGTKIPGEEGPKPPERDLSSELANAVTEFLDRRWAPLVLEPGVGGRVLAFDHSGDVFEVLCLAYPHLPDNLKERVKRFLANEWTQHPPHTARAWYSPDQGARREWYSASAEFWQAAGVIPPHHPFGNVGAVWHYAEVCDEWERIRGSWDAIRDCFGNFRQTQRPPDAGQRELHANRYIASLLALARIAEKLGDRAIAEEARRWLDKYLDVQTARWHRAAEKSQPRVFRDISEWDEFINRGDDLWVIVKPHRAVVALFHDLTPEVANLVKERAPDAVSRLLDHFEQLCPTWFLTGEERQVHFGENLFEPPLFSWDAFRAFHWLRGSNRPPNPQWIDIPGWRADLYFIGKLAIARHQR